MRNAPNPPTFTQRTQHTTRPAYTIAARADTHVHTLILLSLSPHPPSRRHPSDPPSASSLSSHCHLPTPLLHPPTPSLILTPSSSFLPSLSLPLLILPSVRGQIAFATDIFVVQTFAVKLDKQQQVYRSPAESTFLESSGFEPEVEMDTITNSESG